MDEETKSSINFKENPVEWLLYNDYTNEWCSLLFMLSTAEYMASPGKLSDEECEEYLREFFSESEGGIKSFRGRYAEYRLDIPGNHNQRVSKLIHQLDRLGRIANSIISSKDYSGRNKFDKLNRVTNLASSRILD